MGFCHLSFKLEPELEIKDLIGEISLKTKKLNLDGLFELKLNVTLNNGEIYIYISSNSVVM